MEVFMKTVAIADKYKGFDVVGIWAVDDEGNKVGKAPIISMGANKAKAIIEHIEDLKRFIEVSATTKD
jgi:formylmethanofuran dehydrogenase subunit E-like metal-binding protein